ncbi:16261_t:CDS:2, partial [Funneliformis caledonium]
MSETIDLIEPVSQLGKRRTDTIKKDILECYKEEKERRKDLFQ